MHRCTQGCLTSQKGTPCRLHPNRRSVVTQTRTLRLTPRLLVGHDCRLVTRTRTTGTMATGIRDPAAATYTFASQPRAVAPQRKKFRDGEQTTTMQSCNIMYDPRVVRGNTYRQTTVTNAPVEDPVEVQRRREARRRRQARERAAAKIQSNEVDAVPGRIHIEVQTDVYLEELSDRVEEADIAVQTDPFLDRAPDPVFIPAKTGIDAETQIQDGELFDFDLESKPVLEVLVGKTIEQAMMEVMEEEELDRLRDHQIKFEELRNAELIETQRLEEQARRRREEKNRRLHQQAEVALAEKEASKRIAARSFAQSYLSGLVPSVFQNLEDGGYFYDAQEREVESEFIPWLLDGVDSELATFTRSRALLDDIIAHVIKTQYPPAAAQDEPAGAEDGPVVDGDEPTAPSAAYDAGDTPGAPEGEADGSGAGDAPSGGGGGGGGGDGNNNDEPVAAPTDATESTEGGSGEAAPANEDGEATPAAADE
eukprot:m.173014 g.173014  ORF g.173014 m.173014 type:complete len:481 (+) comp13625_c0_seq1:112-1554(+)